MKTPPLSIVAILLLLGVETRAFNHPPSLEEVASKIELFVANTNNAAIEARSPQQPRCALACNYLHHILPGQISFPANQTYQLEESGYWSVQQATTLPTCRFTPSTSIDVSLGVLTARVTSCKFAVKSGGHAAFSGASNIQDGITFDLKKLDTVSISPGRTSTAVGAGNTWYSVYSQLDPYNITVIGGRVAAIGTGGLTLGGGISFFSNRYGWACDNVHAYEVVFADGTIHNVSQASFPDLYWALRGGGNNFGIVTKFYMDTYPQGDLWAGTLGYLYTESLEERLNDAFSNLNLRSEEDPYAQLIYVVGYSSELGGWATITDLQYGKPVINPPIFENFTSVPEPVINTLKVQNLSALTVDFNNSNPGGFRQTYWTLTVKNSPTLLHDIITIYRSEISPLLSPPPTSFLPSLVFQPISLTVLSHFTKNGGNALGLSPSDGPLILINIATSWSDEADDARIFQAIRNVIFKANETAWKQGMGVRFLYQNYAAAEQNVFAGYGEENLKRLRRVSEMYDPDGVWWRLQPGYFKLW